MKWSEARKVAKTGQRIRWRTWRYWWRQGTGALWFKETESGQTVIQAGDVQKEYFLGDQWTTEEFSDSDLDPCAREAARKPEFYPPGISVDASWTDGVMAIKGGISEGSDGTYRLEFLINGQVVARREATGSAQFSLAVPTIFAPSLQVALLVKSSLPLDPWSDVALKIVTPVAPPVTGEVLLPITAAEFAALMAGGTWTAEMDGVMEESYVGGSASGTGSGMATTVMAGGTAELTVVYEGDVTYSTGGTWTEHFSDAFTISLSVGWSEGYKLGVTISGIQSTSGDDTGFGSLVATVLGRSVPTRSHWYPGWAGNPGYTNDTVLNLDMTFAPGS